MFQVPLTHLPHKQNNSPFPALSPSPTSHASHFTSHHSTAHGNIPIQFHPIITSTTPQPSSPKHQHKHKTKTAAHPQQSLPRSLTHVFTNPCMQLSCLHNPPPPPVTINKSLSVMVTSVSILSYPILSYPLNAGPYVCLSLSVLAPTLGIPTSQPGRPSSSPPLPKPGVCM